MLFAQFKEVKGILVLHRQLRLCTQRGREGPVEVGLAKQRFLVALVIDLVDEHILGPAELACHAQVEFTFLRVLATLQDDEVVRPADLCNQRLHFHIVAVEQKKFPHVEHVSTGKSTHTRKGVPQVICQPFCNGRTMSGILLPFHDQPPDIPIQADKFLVDRPQRRVLRGPDARLDLGQESWVVFLRKSLSHRWCEFLVGGSLARSHRHPLW